MDRPASRLTENHDVLTGHAFRVAACGVLLCSLLLGACRIGRTPERADLVIAGNLLDTSGGANLYYGSVVYLIPDSGEGHAWWGHIADRARYRLADPYLELHVPYADRTVCDSAGRFTFARVRPGNYYLHARVFWSNVVGFGSVVDAQAWIGSTSVGASETTIVTLRPPELMFRGFEGGGPPDSGLIPGRPSTSRDDSLARLGWPTYVTEPAVLLRGGVPKIPTGFDLPEKGHTILVDVFVDDRGLVREAKLESLPDVWEGLRKPALEAAKRYVYRPAYRGRRRVASWAKAPVTFVRF